MKKKALLLMVAILAMVALMAGMAQAQSWVKCNLTEVNANSWMYYVIADEAAGAFTGRVFFIDESSGKGKEMLAAALTGFASTTPVNLYLYSTANLSTAFGVAPATK